MSGEKKINQYKSTTIIEKASGVAANSEYSDKQTNNDNRYVNSKLSTNLIITYYFDMIKNVLTFAFI